MAVRNPQVLGTEEFLMEKVLGNPHKERVQNSIELWAAPRYPKKEKP